MLCNININANILILVLFFLPIHSITLLVILIHLYLYVYINRKIARGFATDSLRIVRYTVTGFREFSALFFPNTFL